MLRCLSTIYSVIVYTILNDDRDRQGDRHGHWGGGGVGVIPCVGCEYYYSILINSTAPRWSIRTRQVQRLNYQKKPLVSSCAWSYIRRNRMHCLTPWGKFFKFNCVQLWDPHLIGGFSSLRVLLLGRSSELEERRHWKLALRLLSGSSCELVINITISKCDLIPILTPDGLKLLSYFLYTSHLMWT